MSFGSFCTFNSAIHSNKRKRISTPIIGTATVSSTIVSVAFTPVSEQINGLYFTIYDGYFNDNVAFTRANLRTAGLLAPNTGYNSNISGLNVGTNGAIPSSGNSLDYFTIEWTGLFLANSTGTWTFFTTSDDASYLWIGSNATSGYTTTNAIVNNGGNHTSIERSGTISLTSGTYYPIRILYGENGGGETCIVSFTPPSGTKTTNGTGYYYNSSISYSVTSSPGGLTGTGATSPISVSGLIPNTIYTFTVYAFDLNGTSEASSASTAVTTITSAPTLGTATSISTTEVSVAFTPFSGATTTSGLYFTIYDGYFADSMTFTSTAPLRTSGLLASNTGYNSNISNINPGTNGAIPTNGSLNFFTVEWTGFFLANVTGTWTFFTNSDDGSFLWIGSNATSGYTTTNAIVKNGGPHGPFEVSGTISLTSGTYYPIRILYGEDGGSENCIVSFTPPSGTKTTDGTGYYYSSNIIYTVTSSPGSLIATGPNSPIRVSGLTPNTIYTFTATATNSGGISAVSSASTEVTTRSGAPTIGTATVTSSTVVSVAFTAPSGTGAITSYTVTSSTGGTGIITGTGTTSPISVSGLTANTIYTFTVTATNSGGTSVASSASTSVTTISNAPTIGTATITSSTAVSVAFTAPSGGTGTISGYTVTSSPGAFTGTGISSPITVSGLALNTAYTFTVFATNNGGNSTSSAPSNSITITDFQLLLINKPPWGRYSASSWVQSTLTLTDQTGNGRHGVATGTVTQSTASGNGATASINSIGGVTTTTLLFPAGSIPAPYTMCSISRYTGGTFGRILQSSTDNWLHGHHAAGPIKRGVHYNGAWRTDQTGAGVATDWLNFITTSGNTSPNNILRDGVGVGTSAGSNAIVSALAINIGPFTNEASNWGLTQLIIWNQVLLPEEMVIVSNAFTQFLATGVLS